MSVSSGLSGRYAKAIYELAEEKKILTKIVDDFISLKELLEESDSLSNLIKSPAISKSDKHVNIQDVILNWTRKINTPNHIKLTIDIDPFSFM